MTSVTDGGEYSCASWTGPASTNSHAVGAAPARQRPPPHSAPDCGCSFSLIVSMVSLIRVRVCSISRLSARSFCPRSSPVQCRLLPRPRPRTRFRHPSARGRHSCSLAHWMAVLDCLHGPRGVGSILLVPQGTPHHHEADDPERQADQDRRAVRRKTLAMLSIWSASCPLRSARLEPARSSPAGAPAWVCLTTWSCAS